MSFSEYTQFDGLGLASLVKSKEVSSLELIEAAIAQIETENPSLNAVINTFYELAKKESRETSYTDHHLFAGVPMLLKDITQEIKGQTITSGSLLFQHNIAKDDSEFVKRLRKTGTVFIGQTNVPELALMGIIEPTLYGPTRNPRNHDYTPGGSSGGSAAAVASGMVPIAGANDGGGSIRIPAAYCGLFGLKPTRGRTPTGPSYGRHWQGASVDHILSRSVRDSAAMLDAIQGSEKGAAFHTSNSTTSFLSSTQKLISKPLTIAFSVQSPLDTEVHSDCKQAVLNCVQMLEDAGHHVVEKSAPVNGQTLAKSYLTMYFGEVAATLSLAAEQLGRKVAQKDVEPTTWLLGLLDKATTAEEFVLGLREWDKAAFAMEAFHETYDLYLTPTTAFPPAKIGELALKNYERKMISIVSKLGLGAILKKTAFVDQLAIKSLEKTPFTQLANLTGQPAMSLPLYQTREGLPCGVQVMAARGKESLLYQLAGQLEQSSAWVKPIITA
ncbi:amidase family protein [Halalkalibacter akibai]|uniref:Aspartyl-tRNA(Asn) amidotransferase subunit A n=1 Tax=Halalkalibacter akibai (strain ATCC 43226 / DSM 21942 / CIP 109018 / JCM 9157 / 1139) TaxID=1236973 RepID=W4QU89_HALA3|nr:amidase family protein [Halalkalibacter akibai]GAE35735.1 aspartyl-tRNA(Asn) amidotransferase subunit A [Halalkalibacter akibai JCM 9157]